MNNQNSKWAAHQSLNAPNLPPVKLEVEKTVIVPLEEETPLEVELEVPTVPFTEEVIPVEEPAKVEAPKVELKAITKKK